MTSCFVACAVFVQHAIPASLGYNFQSGIIAALGTAAFIIGTILRRTQASRNELNDSQAYEPRKQKVAVDNPRVPMGTAAESAVQQSNANAA